MGIILATVTATRATVRPNGVAIPTIAVTYSGPTTWVRFGLAIANTLYTFDLGSSFGVSGSMQLGQPQATLSACGPPGSSTLLQVSIFNYPASFDAYGNVSSVQPVTLTATFTDPQTGAVAATASTVVA